MTKKRRVYISRVVGDQVMTSADLERLHKELLEYERIDFISDEMRAVIETCGLSWCTSSRQSRGDNDNDAGRQSKSDHDLRAEE
jgi:hypothetical protein